MRTIIKWQCRHDDCVLLGGCNIRQQRCTVRQTGCRHKKKWPASEIGKVHEDCLEHHPTLDLQLYDRRILHQILLFCFPCLFFTGNMTGFNRCDSRAQVKNGHRLGHSSNDVKLSPRRYSSFLFWRFKGSSVIFEVFLNPYSRRICLDSPPPPGFRTKKKFDGHPNVYVYQYVLEHPYKLHAGQGHSSTPLPFTTTTSLTAPHCAMFIELFLLEHLRCFFVTDDRQRRVFCRERRLWQSCTAGGGCTSHAFTSTSVRKGSFRWRLAWRVTDVCESTQHECENFPNWWRQS